MQKLVFENSNGVSVNLTDFEKYGITDWSGLSECSMDIQSQQVPFNDGSVFLDALLQDRTLSFTVAVNDGGDLQKRYELKRELISILNPKLGEGYLYYTNDYLSRKIKCIPEVPTFPTKNMDNAGTLKASISFTACNPYWESLEEKSETLKMGELKTVNNNGDVPAQVEIDVSTFNVKNFQITNTTTGKKIKLKNEIVNPLLINTDFGNKEITSENFAKEWVGGGYFNCSAENEEICIFGGSQSIILTKERKWETLLVDIEDIIWSKKYKKFIAISNRKVITSDDGYIWNSIEINGNVDYITQSEDTGRVYIIPETQSDLSVQYSDDLETWISVNVPVYLAPYVKTIYAHNNIVLTARQYSTDYGETWNVYNNSIIPSAYTYSQETEKFYCVNQSALGDKGLYQSEDALEWVLLTEDIETPSSPWNFCSEITCYNNKIFFSNYYYDLSDNNLVTFTQKANNVSNYLYTLGVVAYAGFGIIGIIENDLSDTVILMSLFSELSIMVMKKIDENYILAGQGNYIYITSNFKDFRKIELDVQNVTINQSLIINSIKKLDNKIFLLGNNGLMFYSEDGENYVTKQITTTQYRILCDIDLVNNIYYVISNSRYYNCSSLSGEWTEHNYFETEGESFAGSRFIHINNKIGIIGLKKITEGNVTLNKFCCLVTDDMSYFNEIEIYNYGSTSGRVFQTNYYDFIVVDNIIICYGRYAIGKGIFKTENLLEWEICNTSDYFNFLTYVEKLKYYIAGDSDYNSYLKSSSDLINFKILEPKISLFFKDSFQFTPLSGINEDENIYFSYWDIIFKLKLVKNENLISKLSTDSDMNFNLDVGENKLLLTYDEGYAEATITFNEKYIGV